MTSWPARRRAHGRRAHEGRAIRQLPTTPRRRSRRWTACAPNRAHARHHGPSQTTARSRTRLHALTRPSRPSQPHTHVLIPRARLQMATICPCPLRLSRLPHQPSESPNHRPSSEYRFLAVHGLQRLEMNEKTLCHHLVRRHAAAQVSVPQAARTRHR